MTDLTIINFGHPMTEGQLRAVREQYATDEIEVITIKVQLDIEQPLAPQIAALVDGLPLSAEELQTRSIVINPPGLAPAAVVLLAELHGRMGYFPPVIRMKQVAGPPPVFEVAEIIDLASVRNTARQKR